MNRIPTEIMRSYTRAGVGGSRPDAVCRILLVAGVEGERRPGARLEAVIAGEIRSILNCLHRRRHVRISQHRRSWTC